MHSALTIDSVPSETAALRRRVGAGISADLALLAAATLGFIVLAAWALVRQVPDALEGELTSAAAPILDLVAAMLVARAAATAPGGRLRLAWVLLTIALVAYAIGDALWAWISYVLGGDPFPSVADGAYLGYYGLAAAGLLLFPAAHLATREAVRLAIDSAIVVIGGVMVVWTVLLHPLLDATVQSSATQVLAFAYPVADLVLLFAVGTIALRRPPGIAPPALAALVVGFGLMLAADLGYGAFELLGVQNSVWIDVSYLASTLATGVAGYLQARSPRAGEAGGADRITALLLRAPYAALGGGFVSLFMAIGLGDTVELAELAAGAVMLTALVLVRQEVIGRENARLVALAARRDAEKRYEDLGRNATDALLLVDASGRIDYASPALDRVCGLRPSDVVGRPVLRIAHSEDAERLERLIADTAAGRPVEPLEWRIWTRDGAWRPVETISANLLDDPAIGRIVLTTRNVAERHAFRQQVAQATLRDLLTGLPNRLLFEDRVEQAVAAAQQGGRPAMVLLLDIEGFRRINDTLGHDAGDRVLREVGRRIQASIRGTDTVARLDADAFGILVGGDGEAPTGPELADRLTAVLAKPLSHGATTLEVSAAIGIATSGDPAGGPAEDGAAALLRNADVALAEARRRGRDHVVEFEPALLHDLEGRFELERELRLAVANDELFLEYQPIVDLGTGEIVAAEALVRWRHPTRGVLGPTEFVPLAETAGLIGQIGHWVLRESCLEVARWARVAPGVVPRVSVNLSAPQIADRRLPWLVQSALGAAGAAPGWLTLEITESLLVDRSAEALERLHAIRALGVKLSIDDFGTGYSSLAYLQRFPVNHIKIDRSFVDALPEGADDDGLVPAIVAIARALGMTTIAEGIEHPWQLRRLRDAGCAMGQGYLLDRPLGAEAMRDRVSAAAVPRVASAIPDRPPAPVSLRARPVARRRKRTMLDSAPRDRDLRVAERE
jgi:diguanylate cyclase (GGDEF)-like protein/PAS domain S-box-containing protein